MNSTVQVSVICVNYNHEKYIREALDSILMQKTNFVFEILVGEDCSTDGTRAILKEYEIRYPEQFCIFYRKKNLGATVNEYELLQEAEGKYIAALELDDIWTDSEKLQKQYNFMETHSEYMGVAHDFSLIDKSGQTLSMNDRKDLERFLGKDFTLNNFLKVGFVFQTGCHFYRNIWQDGGDYTVIYKADRLIRDKTILSILLERGPFFILTDVMSAYRRFFDSDATNGRNVTNSNLPQDLFDKCHHVEVLDTYFKGKIDYSEQWCTYVFDYLKGCFKHKEEGYTFCKLLYLYRHADYRTKKKIKNEAKATIKNALHRK